MDGPTEIPVQEVPVQEVTPVERAKLMAEEFTKKLQDKNLKDAAVSVIQDEQGAYYIRIAIPEFDVCLTQKVPTE